MAPSSRMAPSSWHRSALRRVVVLGAVVVALVVPAVLDEGAGTSPAGAQAAPPYVLQVSKTERLHDSDRVTVTVRGLTGTTASGRVLICRDGPTYDASMTAAEERRHCPSRAAATFSSWNRLSSPLTPFRDGTGSIGWLQVGIGTAEWTEVDPVTGSTVATHALTCNAQNPCRLVAVIRNGAATYWDSSTLLTYEQGGDVVAGCDGFAEDRLSLSGPSRHLQGWVAWTQALCRYGGNPQQITAPLLSGEGEGHERFASGQADLIFSGVGTAFPGGAAEGPSRSSVLVPIGLNAAVIGVLGGYPSPPTANEWPASIPMAYSDVTLTLAEAATLVGQGTDGLTNQWWDPVMARNPQLAASARLQTPTANAVIALQGADAATYFWTDRFRTEASSWWHTGRLGSPEDPTPDVPRTTSASFSAAVPGYGAHVISMMIDRPSLVGNVFRHQTELQPGAFGPVWVLTDLMTARQLGIPTVSIEVGPGNVVQPDGASVTRAVAAQDPDDGGLLLPGPTSSLPRGSYPLSFVEYAIAPAESLVREDCTPRTMAQSHLDAFLGHLTGAGHGTTTGLVGLTPELRVQAAAAVERVGATTPTGACAPAPPAPTPPGAGPERGTPGGARAVFPGLLPGDLFGSLPWGSSDSLGGGGGGADGLAGGPAGDGSGSDDGDSSDGGPGADAGTDLPVLPPFAGNAASKPVRASLALMGVTLLSACAGAVTSGSVRTRGRRGVARP